jgi:hypothetical protein
MTVVPLILHIDIIATKVVSGNEIIDRLAKQTTM